MTKLLNEGIRHECPYVYKIHRCFHKTTLTPYRDYKINGTIIRVKTLCEMETVNPMIVQFVEELLQEAKEQILYEQNKNNI